MKLSKLWWVALPLLVIAMVACSSPTSPAGREIAITFDANGGTLTDSPTLNYFEGKIPGDRMPNDPVRAGYIFAGWNERQDGIGRPFGALTEIDSTWSLTVYAQWGAIGEAYTVTFNANGGRFLGGISESKASTEPGGSTVTPPDDPTRSDKFFIEWNTRQDGSGNVFDGKGVNGDMTVYAQWEDGIPADIAITVTFDNYGGDTEAVPKTRQTISGGTVALPTINPSQNGKTFSGWYTRPSSGGDEFTAETIVNANTIVYARWYDISYTVTFSATGGVFADGTQETRRSTPVGGTVSLPDDPTRENHEFLGWSSFTGDPFSPTGVTRDITVFAQWEEVLAGAVHVTFDKNGGDTEASPRTKPVIPGGTVELPLPPTCLGWQFNGWNTEQTGGTGATAFDENTVVEDNITVFAQWTEHFVSVTFDKNGGETDANTTSATVRAGEKVALPSTNPTWAGHTFKGWNTQRNGYGDVFTAETIVENDITVFAQWGVDSYTILFNGNGGIVTGSTTVLVDHGETLGEKIPDVTRGGHTFVEWNTTQTGGGEVLTADTIIDSDWTVYAQWTADVYTVTFNANGGSFVGGEDTKEVETAPGELTVTPPAVDRPDFMFEGWNTLQNGSGDSFNGTGVTGNMTVYAQWEEIVAGNVIVTFNDNIDTGTVFHSAQTEAGGRVSLPLSDPGRAGYTFGGWFTEKAGGTEFTEDTIVPASITVYAKWTAREYTITYKDVGDTTFSGTNEAALPTTHTYDTATTLVSATKDGYTFGGWFTALNGTGTALTSLAATAYTENITLYAKWTAGEYTITYKDVGDTTFSGTNEAALPTTHTYGTATTLVPATKADNIFDGWFTAQDGFGDALTSLAATAYTANITLYAKWTTSGPAYTYTVTFDGNGGTPATQTKTVVAPATTIDELPAQPTRDGYTFDKWTITTGDFTASTTVNGDMTVTAQWTGNAVTKYTVTVVGGTGATGSDDYAAGETVNINAGTAPAGQEFDNWTATGVTLTNPTSASTSFTMPANAVTVTANWKDIGGITPFTFPYSYVSGGTAMTVAEGPSDIHVEVYPGDGKTPENGTRLLFDDASTSGAVQHWDQGGSATWTIQGGATDENIYIKVLYAKGNTATENMSVTINGVSQTPTITLAPNGAWTTTFLESPQSGPFTLKGGQPNTITLAGGGSNVRAMIVTLAGSGGTTYLVTVNSVGTGASSGGNYAPGATVTINAGTPPAGQTFSGWTVDSGGVTVANTSPATFTMPSNAVTVTANFSGGGGGGIPLLFLPAIN